MDVLVNSVGGGSDLTERVRGVIDGHLERFQGWISRVEVDLIDLNGQKLGERDKRCIMEARLRGMSPIAVSHEASTLAEAIHVAADELERAVEQAFSRLETMPGQSVEALRSLEHIQPEGK
jgi:ribosome-associated translation inhibitor RaiA